jgi:hypothetical protein
MRTGNAVRKIYERWLGVNLEYAFSLWAGSLTLLNTSI